MKVLHLYPGRHFGGIETMLVTLARARAACPAMEPAFAVCYERGQLARDLRAAGARVFPLGAARTRFPWQILRARARLRRRLAAEPFDVAVCHCSWTLALLGGAVRRAGVPLVYWMHNKAAPASRNLVERLAGRLAPDLAVCNSQFTARTLPVLFGRKIPPHRVISCPVEPPPPAQRTALRKELGVAEDTGVIIQVGRLERGKGHRLHLAALSRLHALPGWVCWIVGGAATAAQARYLAELKTLAAVGGLADRVRFLGQRRDVRPLLAAADIFCQPNEDSEAFGIVFVEALYAGLPVVAARHGGVLEIVDETCARLVPPGDADALAEALGSLLEDRPLRARLAEAAPRRAALIASPARTLGEMHAVFAGVLAGKRTVGG